MENVYATIVYNRLDVLHEAVTHFNFIFVEYLFNGAVLQEIRMS